MEKRFCSHCGSEVNPEAVICVKCGCALNNNKVSSNGVSRCSDELKTLVNVFFILRMISSIWAICIPLIWVIPMYKKSMAYLNGEIEMDQGYKICVLLFASLVPGIVLLTIND